MDLTQITTYLPQMLSGVLTTIELMVCALIVGLMLAFALTIVSLSHRWYLRFPIGLFTFFIRGTPLLVQIFIIYFGLGQFEWLRATPLWDILRQPFACAVIAFALNTCGYTIVILKGAIHCVPEGEVMACHALGMSKWQMMRRVILPRALRTFLPAYSNEVIMILKGTSLASTITILDLMGVTNQIIAVTYATIPLLMMAGLFYLILNSMIIGIFKWLEKKTNVYIHCN